MFKTWTTEKTFNSLKCPETQPATHLARRLLFLRPRGQLSPMISRAHFLMKMRTRALSVSLVSLLALSGCLNQVNSSKRTPSSRTVAFTQLPNPETQIIQTVLRSQHHENDSLDVLGSAAFQQSSSTPGLTAASDALGDFCGPTPEEKFACRCKIIFQSKGSSKASVSIELNPLYVESNLVRCPIPEGYESGVLQVALVRDQGNQKTNTYSFNPVPDSAFNDPSLYKRVERYVCREAPFVPHMMTGDTNTLSMIDPIQSDSPRATSRHLFYTTNWGRSLADFSNGSPSNFECPPHVSPHKASLALFKNGVLISDSSGNAVLQNGQDHVNFWLAERPIGPFTWELKISQSPGAPARTLGYAAAINETGGCPGTAPSNYAWKKLWLFSGEAEPSRGYWVSKPYQNFDVACPLGAFQPKSPPLSTGSAGGYTFFSNNYHLLEDCGKRVSDAKRDDPNLLFNSLSCNSPAGPNQGIPASQTQGLSRALIPKTNIVALYPEYSHRCVNILATGNSWQEACSTSMNSCNRVRAGKAHDPFGLCHYSARADAPQVLSIEKSDGDIARVDLSPSTRQYVFYVAAEDSAFKDFGSDFELSSPPVPGQIEKFFIRNSLNGVPFPNLCVLQKKVAGSQ